MTSDSDREPVAEEPAAEQLPLRARRRLAGRRRRTSPQLRATRRVLGQSRHSDAEVASPLEVALRGHESRIRGSRTP